MKKNKKKDNTVTELHHTQPVRAKTGKRNPSLYHFHNDATPPLSSKQNNRKKKELYLAEGAYNAFRHNVRTAICKVLFFLFFFFEYGKKNKERETGYTVKVKEAKKERTASLLRSKCGSLSHLSLQQLRCKEQAKEQQDKSIYVFFFLLFEFVDGCVDTQCTRPQP